MSSIVKTDAVVLRSVRYGESSRIVTFYTREHGKLAAVVKGASQLKRRIGPLLEPLSCVSLVVYKKEGREVQTVSECEPYVVHKNLRTDLEAMAVGMAIIELVLIVTHEEEPNHPLFPLIIGSLGALDHATRNRRNVLYMFEMRLAEVLGFRPMFNRCVACGRPPVDMPGKRVRFDIRRGGYLCPACDGRTQGMISLTPAVFRLLDHLSLLPDPGAAERLRISPAQKKEIELFFTAYFQNHVAGMRMLRSEKVFSKLLATV